jgi:hypothetical protein
MKKMKQVEEVELVASGYEWCCPKCDQWNGGVVEVPNQGEGGKCENCGCQVLFIGVNHACN